MQIIKNFFSAKVSDLFFCLKADAQGMYIETVDKNGKETGFDYRQYSGLLRIIARSVQMIKDRYNFTIDWENPDRRLYLHEHPYLVPQLLESNTILLVSYIICPTTGIHHNGNFSLLNVKYPLNREALEKNFENIKNSVFL